MFFVSFITLQLFQRVEQLIVDFMISSLDPFLITGKIFLKSLPNITTFPPKGLFKFSSHSAPIRSHIVRSMVQNITYASSMSHPIYIN